MSHSPWRTLSIVLLLLLLAGCATRGPSEVGVASYYSHPFHGRQTASGRTYNHNKLTAAHPTLPFGTRVRVTNLRNGRKIVLTITDRGPYANGRIIDVSRRAARELGFWRRGITRVKVEVLRS